MRIIYAKKITLIVLFIILYLLTFTVLMPRLIKGSSDVLSGEKHVIITGDFNDNTSFGFSVLTGFETALLEKGKSKSRFQHIKIPINENLVQNVNSTINIETSQLSTDFKKELISKISSKNVIAIISANTSQTILPCLEVGKTFNIPVLITVATNNKITQPYEGIYYRLLANNSTQADEIIRWMNNYEKNDSSYFGVLYSPTIYGNNLLDVIRSKIGFEYVIPFSISTTTDMVGTISYGKRIGVSAWVSLSYLKESMEIQIKKEHIDYNSTPILFSDGAYGNWIEKIHQNKEKNVFLSFPETYPQDSERIGNVGGFGVFGYDAYWLIDYCLENEMTIDKSLLVEKLSEFEPPVKNNLIQTYRFEEGENKLANFKTYNIHEIIP